MLIEAKLKRNRLKKNHKNFHLTLHCVNCGAVTVRVAVAAAAATTCRKSELDDEINTFIRLKKQVEIRWGLETWFNSPGCEI